MKKFISMAVLFTMAAALFTGCDKKKTTIEAGGVDLKLSVASSEVAPGNKLQFTVSSETAPLSDVVINVSSDKTDVATVPATVTLKAGDGAVSEFITAVAEGEATIKISAANDVKISVSEVKITVKAGVVPPAKPKVSIFSKFGEVAPGAKIAFEIKAASASEADAVINVVSSNTAAATVPASLTLKKGDSAVSGEITGVAAGKSTITISSESADIQTSSIEIEVKEGAATAPVLSISAGSEVAERSKIKFTVSSPVAPESDIAVTVVSSSTANATVTSPVTLKAGERSVQGEITGVAAGSATISIEAGSTPIGEGSVEVTVVEGGPIEYCEAEAFCGYSSLEFVKFGDKKFVGGVENPPYFTGSMDITSSTLSYELQYNREGFYGGASYDDDTFTIAIFADWTRTGKLTKVASHNIIDKQSKPTQLVSGTLDIPSDASVEGMIRVIQWFTGDRTESTINANGCGYAESGGVFDISYTIQ